MGVGWVLGVLVGVGVVLGNGWFSIGWFSGGILGVVVNGFWLVVGWWFSCNFWVLGFGTGTGWFCWLLCRWLGWMVSGVGFGVGLLVGCMGFWWFGAQGVHCWCWIALWVFSW